jgi:hypothetical protein
MHELVERAWKETKADPEKTVDLLCRWTGLGLHECIQILMEAKREEAMRWADAEEPSMPAILWAFLRLAAKGKIYDTGRRRHGRIVWADAKFMVKH